MEGYVFRQPPCARFIRVPNWNCRFAVKRRSNCCRICGCRKPWALHAVSVYSVGHVYGHRRACRRLCIAYKVQSTSHICAHIQPAVRCMALCIFRHAAVAHCIRPACFRVENMGGEAPISVARHVDHTLWPHAAGANCSVDCACCGASQFALASGAWLHHLGVAQHCCCYRNDFVFWSCIFTKPAGSQRRIRHGAFCDNWFLGWFGCAFRDRPPRMVEWR